MAKVEFLATTLTSRGRFEKGEVADFPDAEAKDLQRLSSVKSGKTSTVKEEKKPSVKKEAVKKSAEKVEDK